MVRVSPLLPFSSAHHKIIPLLIGTAIQSSILGRGGRIKGSVVDVLIGQGKLWFRACKFSHYVNLSSCAELVRQRRKLSIVGIPIHYVSGPSIEVSGYHIDCTLSGLHQFSIGNEFLGRTVDSHLSGAVDAECSVAKLSLRRRHLSLSTNITSNLCLWTSLESGRKVSMSLNNCQQPNNCAGYCYFIYNAVRALHSSYLCTESGSRGLHNSSSCSSVWPACDIPLDPFACEEHLTNAAGSSERKIPSQKTLKLISGSCYLPHPAKEETGGEDAHFICSEEQAIGVADGWTDHGVDAGQYSRELMSNSVDAIWEEPKGSIDPARVLEKAHLSTKAKGSSTACIIALTDQGLHAINLGNSGFMVVRDGCTIFRSPAQQHNYNFAYQLESGNNGDLPSSGQVFTISVAPGDVIVAGTDGLFDNLYNNDITAVVVHAIRAGLSPQATAQKIAALARQRAQDKDRQTPFSTAAQDLGVRYYGGKLDDTTVIVSYITSSEDA